MKKEEYLP